MRGALQTIGVPEHIGLAYDAWAPVGDDGKVPDGERTPWLNTLVKTSLSPDYHGVFDRWRKSFSPHNDRVFTIKFASRLLIGHGNASATDVGLTVHHTWGVPVIPGSAIKGLLAHFVDAVYGPHDPAMPPWEQSGEERVRADYQGVTWKDRRIARGPGSVYRSIFGAPEAEEDQEMRNRGFDAGASTGLVTFHDAIYVPKKGADDKPLADDKPFAVDVITVHQKVYYDSSGASWPNDYDSPNPVAFLTVRPGVEMLFALSGPRDWTELAERLLRDALERWGVGGKTSSGYGRASPSTGGPQRGTSITRPPPITLPKPGERVIAELLDKRTNKGGWKAKHEASGLSGPIQNTTEVPADKTVGDKLELVVKSSNERELAFRYEGAAPKQPARSDDKGRGRGGGGRDRG